MLGSSLSISGPNVVLNTVVAEELKQFADELERGDCFTQDVLNLIKKTVKEHKRIIFNGNNYSDEWVAEAERRGLLNLKSTADCMPYFIHAKNVKLFTEHHIFTEAEMHSRYEIILENYCKTLNIEALTMLQMSKKSIIPAVSAYTKELADAAISKKQIGADTSAEERLAKELSAQLSCFLKAVDALDLALLGAKQYPEIGECAKYYRESVFTAMQELRGISDTMETFVSKKIWPWPTYGDMLFSV